MNKGVANIMTMGGARVGNLGDPLIRKRCWTLALVSIFMTLVTLSNISCSLAPDWTP